MNNDIKLRLHESLVKQDADKIALKFLTNTLLGYIEDTNDILKDSLIENNSQTFFERATNAYPFIENKTKEISELAKELGSRAFYIKWRITKEAFEEPNKQ